MTKACLILAIVLLTSLGSAQFSKCPNANALQVAQDTITVSRQGQVALQSGADIQCYNYTLATPFNCTPGVAIAVNDFQSQYSPNLFFSIKAVNSDSNGVIPFIVRTHWGYTQWTKISFSFFAEASSQVEAGYYQLDTASLSACYSGKTIIAFLPFVSQNIPGNSAITFLNGFEISSISVNSSYLTPFQVQVTATSVTSQGINIILTSTSATQIHSLFISYIVYDAEIQNLVAGSYTYDQYVPSSSLVFTPPIGISSNNLGFHGFNGFIVRNNKAAISLTASLLKGNLTFTTSSNYYYLSYSYFYLIGGPCGQCVGYNINYDGNCVASCPPNSYYNGQNCVACQAGEIWNGKSCVSRCVNGQIWDNTAIACVCPSGLNWDGSKCISCPTGQVWLTATNVCGCANGNWNGATCISCNNGQIWSSTTKNCVCPQGFNWNGYSCITCQSGQVWSASSNSCSCPSGQNWNGFSCITCDGGRSWSSSLNSCACPAGQNWNGAICITCTDGSNWNGYSCVTCASGQVWSTSLSVCQCPTGQQWNGSACITPCPTGMTNVNGLCVCPAGTYSVNGACVKQPSCASGQTWNGLQCVAIQCPVGTEWNGTICNKVTTITCPAGTYYDGTKCATSTTTCPTGTVWINNACQSTGSCPNGTYLSGTQCVAISQLCPTGLVWQNNQCVTTTNTCPTGSYYNGAQCVPIQPCSSGRVWNTTVSQCVCPTGTFWNGNICIQCTGGQTYQINVGCFCPNGTFYDGSKCTAIAVNQCASVANSAWNGNACVCNPGYSVIGMQCVCEGLAVSSSYCDRCANKASSSWINGVCQCNAGLSEVNGKCVVPTTPVTPVTPTTPSTPSTPTTPSTPSTPVAVPSCNVATYWDNQQLKCLPCSSGCLSCTSCYACTSCQPGFYLDFTSSLCLEVCGDGKRFTLGCDDGNNANGDGCSSDCKVQVGFTCAGGSPNSKDTCSKTLPQALKFTSTGQSHLWGKIVLNVQVNYLPLALIQSASDCKNQCNNVLSVKIVSGDSSATSIVASYIPTTSYSFSIEINYAKEPIGLFSVQVGVNPNLVQKYFSGIDVSKTLSINVNPAYLSLYNGGDDQNSVLGNE